ncbi:hypothetical protein B9479_003232 [Cryptococcus floricola]|uniref:Uncharacterized protein n=1 Tax=Cryptococcus floricola TaxID=2591691 RepID=A0A5D3AZ38_9TREE|nr:hypothetical protein B9479_003232 [Cryptococcus floricola]
MEQSGEITHKLETSSFIVTLDCSPSTAICARRLISRPAEPRRWSYAYGNLGASSVEPCETQSFGKQSPTVVVALRLFYAAVFSVQQSGQEKRNAFGLLYYKILTSLSAEVRSQVPYHLQSYDSAAASSETSPYCRVLINVLTTKHSLVPRQVVATTFAEILAVHPTAPINLRFQLMRAGPAPAASPAHDMTAIIAMMANMQQQSAAMQQQMQQQSTAIIDLLAREKSAPAPAPAPAPSSTSEHPKLFKRPDKLICPTLTRFTADPFVVIRHLYALEAHFRSARPNIDPEYYYHWMIDQCNFSILRDAGFSKGHSPAVSPNAVITSVASWDLAGEVAGPFCDVRRFVRILPTFTKSEMVAKMAATAYLWVENVPTSDIDFRINGGNIVGDTRRDTVSTPPCEIHPQPIATNSKADPMVEDEDIVMSEEATRTDELANASLPWDKEAYLRQAAYLRKKRSGNWFLVSFETFLSGSLWNPDTASTVGGTAGLGYHTLDPSTATVQFVDVTGLTTEIST